MFVYERPLFAGGDLVLESMEMVLDSVSNFFPERCPASIPLWISPQTLDFSPEPDTLTVRPL